MNFESRAQWLVSGVYTFAEKAGGTILSFLSFALLVRMLDKEGFGIWTQFFTVVALMELLRSGFIRTPAIRFMSAATKEEYAQVQTAALLLNLLITVVSIVALSLLALPLSRLWQAAELAPLFYLYTFIALAYIPFSHFESIQHANSDFKGVTYGYLALRGAFFLFIVTYWFLGIVPDLPVLAVAQAVSILLGAVVSGIFARRYLTRVSAYNKKWAIDFLQYGKYTLGTSLGASVVRNIDVWMLGSLISPVAVAIYTPAVRVANLFEVPANSLSSVFFPQAVKKLKEEGLPAAKRLYEKSVSLLFAFLLPFVLGVIMLSDWVVWIIAGDGYAETVPILQVTMFYGLLIPFNRQLGIILDAMGKAKLNFFFVLRNALINTVLNYFFIQEFGTIGAAYATLLTFCLVLLINQVYLHRRLGVEASNYFVYALGYYKSGFGFVRGKLNKMRG